MTCSLCGEAITDGLLAVAEDDTKAHLACVQALKHRQSVREFHQRDPSAWAIDPVTPPQREF